MSAELEQSNASHDGYDQWVGRVLDGRYRIESLLGEGGMGAVFVGEHLKLMKKVAIKVIHPEFAGDGDVAERFAREAVAAGQMEHPHVASATDYGTLAEGGAYLVMQYVRGSSLRDVMDEHGALGWLRACEIGAQVADALAAAHQKGYVHRDLKPDNVMLEPRDDGSQLVKVLDFGIARVASEKAVGGGGRALTRVGTVIGTPGYMAPEQALGEPVDYRADLYALGLVMHEVVTGRAVFAQKELTAIVTRQLTESPPRLSAVVEGVPPGLDELVACMLERDKSKRPQSAADVREALSGLVLGAKLQAVASGEQEIPPLATTDLAGATRREPTPLGVPLGTRRTKAATPPAIAATVAVTTGQTSAVHSRAGRPSSAAATAKTAFALGQELGKEVTSRVQRSGMALPLVGVGCAGFALVLTAFVGFTVAFSGDDPPMAPKVVHEEPLPPPPPPDAEPPRHAPVPDALAQAAFDVVNAEESRAREAAARVILDHAPREEVPPFLVAVAEIEVARSCNDKKPIVQRLAQIGDPRALPALDRLDAEPRNGCRGRMFRRVDCLSCLRTDLGVSLALLRARLAE